VHAGAAADLQTTAGARAEQLAQGAVDAEWIGVALGGEELLLVPVRDVVVRRLHHVPSPLSAPSRPTACAVYQGLSQCA
jgi:hypothetical protein